MNSDEDEIKRLNKRRQNWRSQQMMRTFCMPVNNSDNISNSALRSNNWWRQTVCQYSDGSTIRPTDDTIIKSGPNTPGLIMRNNPSRRQSFLYRSSTNSEQLKEIASSNQMRLNYNSETTNVLITPFAQILAILTKARDHLSEYNQSLLNRNNTIKFEETTSCVNEKPKEQDQINQSNWNLNDLSDLLHKFDWCLESLESLQCKRSVSSLTRVKFCSLLSEELAVSQTCLPDATQTCLSDATEQDLDKFGEQNSELSINKSGIKSKNYNRPYLSRKLRRDTYLNQSQVSEFIYKTFMEDDEPDEILWNSATENSNKSTTISSPKLKLNNFYHLKNDQINLNECVEEDQQIKSDKCDYEQILNNFNKITQNNEINSNDLNLKYICNSSTEFDGSIVEKFILENSKLLAPDLFHFDEITNHHPLSTFGLYIFLERNLLNKFSIPFDIMNNCFKQIELKYNLNAPFHNSIHALDVLQTAHQIFKFNKLEEIFSDLEIFATLFACAIHDIDHLGVTNQYLINTNNELAILYNDISVLENHHLYVAFKLINSNKQCNFLQYLTSQQIQIFRKMVINLVLSTDMSKHMSLLADLKTTVEKQRAVKENILNLDSYSSRIQMLECIIHGADLSNPTKPLNIYQKWVSRIMEEMFQQGDKERSMGMEISPMCDRQTACIYSTQVSFIDYIVYPLWETMAELLYPDGQILITNIRENREWYAKENDRRTNETYFISK